MFLQGRIAVVTGGSKGIGKAVATALVQAGAKVLVGARDEGGLQAAVEELQQVASAAEQPVPAPAGHRLQVGDPASVEEFFAWVAEQGGLDILVNNAGIGIFKKVEALTVADWQETINTNLNGVFYCSHAALPLLKQRGGGSILNISSLAARNPFPDGAAYNASKFAITGFSEAMLLDHRQEGIRVTDILPGSVNTGFSPRSQPADWKIQPEDIAQIVIDVLQMPARTLISRVEVRPARPPK